ncbi:MAG TPA: DUF1345 domain-containing protein, partial [Chthoniobacteraceae bacterium]|nr:DUF1345 domain-containing protein [Chthoniobacteraceae bacterium]
MNPTLHRIVSFDAHHRIALALGCAALTLALTVGRFSWPVCIIGAWDAFALCSLALAWAGMLLTDVQKRMREARLQDSSRTVIAVCVVLSAVAGLGASGVLLGSAKGLAGPQAFRHAALAGLTVVASWTLVHTVLALHYAHLSWRIAEKSHAQPRDLGLVFPNEPAPDFLDFAYFSFVIGATGQVSDVQITARGIRRLALVHGMLSFGFNTVILALTINLASSL